MKRVGVLALQGDYAAHARALERAGATPVEVRSDADLSSVQGLVIPGGESTTMLKLLRAERLWDSLREFGQQKPIFGTCAGSILLATEVTNPAQESLGLMDIAVQRNGYGRQLDSRVVRLPVSGSAGQDEEVEAVFIRAPIIRRVGADVRVLARYNGDPVLVEHGLHMTATFHPELTDGLSIHRRFVDRVWEEPESAP